MIRFKIKNLLQTLFFFILISKWFYLLQPNFPYVNPHDFFPWYVFFIRDVLIGFFFSIYLFEYRFLIFKKYSYIFTLFLIFMVAISLVHLSDRGVFLWGYQSIRNTIYYLPFFWIGLSCDNAKIKKELLSIIKILSIFSTAFIFIQTIFIKESLYDNARATALFENPNIAGIILVLSTFVIFFSYGINRFSIVFFFFTGIALSLTASVGSCITFLFIWILLLLKYIRPYKFKKPLLMGIIFLLGLSCHGLIYNKSSNSVLGKVIEIINYKTNNLKHNTIDYRLKNYKNFTKSINNISFKEILLGGSKDLKQMDGILEVFYIFGLVGIVIFVVYPILIIYLILFKKSLNQTNLLTTSVVFTVVISGIFYNYSNRFPINIIFYLFLGLLQKEIINNKKS